MTRVLYVEDEGMLAVVIEGAMQSSGLDVRLAHDGADGIAQATAFQPQIIVTDYMMPRVDGLTMVRKLRDDGIDVPVIVTTAVPEEDFDPDLRRQFDVYIGKPFLEEELLEAIQRLTPEGA